MQPIGTENAVNVSALSSAGPCWFLACFAANRNWKKGLLLSRWGDLASLFRVRFGGTSQVNGVGQWWTFDLFPLKTAQDALFPFKPLLAFWFDQNTLSLKNYSVFSCYVYDYLWLLWQLGVALWDWQDKQMPINIFSHGKQHFILSPKNPQRPQNKVNLVVTHLRHGCM